MISTAIYVRISSDPTGSALGVARQEKDCRALAERRGWAVAAVYRDNDVSAFDKRKVRPEWRRLLADLRDGRHAALVVYDMDRLARRVRDLEDLLDIYEDHRGLGFAAVTGEIDLSTSGGRAMARMLATMALKASEDTGRRVARKHLELAEAGKPAGGVRPFGYADDLLTPVPAEAAAIRSAAHRLLAGDSVARIGQDLDRAGLHPPRAERWSRPSLKYVLTSHRVAGRRRHQGVDFGPAAWPAILDDVTWNACRAVFEANRHSARARPIGNARRFLLSGLARCGVCGHTLIARHPGGHNTGMAYVCPTSREGGCGGVRRRLTAVDDLVIRVVIARLSRPDAADLLAFPGDDEGEALACEVTALRTRLDQVAADFADDALTAEQLRTITRRLRTRLDELQERQAGISRSSVLADLAGRDDVAGRWDRLDLGRRRAVIDALMTVAIQPVRRRGKVFDPESVRIEWKS